MKVAIVHDWLNGMRGGERVLEAFLTMYPQADVFTLFHRPGATTDLIDQHVRQVSFLNRIPGAQRLYRHMLPLYPLAVRGFSFAGYDLVISLSHAAAKNVTVPRGVRHVVYCFTPMRYIWDQADQYFGKGTAFLQPVLAGLRRWDLAGAERPDAFIAISRFVAGRIRCFYHRRASVIHPPVDTSWIRHTAVPGRSGEAFLYAGALVPYKRVDRVIEAFRVLKEPLWVVGTGPEEERLKELAPPNVQFFGRVSDEELGEFYAHCRALIFPATEDFGLVPLECLAAGRPVLALDAGGARETITGPVSGSHVKSLHGATGMFIPRRGDIVKNIVATVERFRQHEDQINQADCVDRAAQFAYPRFEREWRAEISGAWQSRAPEVINS